MIRRIRNLSIALFLLTALTAPVPVKAADCTAFLQNCNVSVFYPFFIFECLPGISCGGEDGVNACIREACPAETAGWSCVNPCSPNGGPCGSGQCE